MQITIHNVKAFTQNPKMGNPAGVILKADNISDQQMQQIAHKTNFSECVFVSKSDNADHKMRFFTPMQEVNYCGHATIAAFHMLSKTGTQETKNSIRTIYYKNGMIEIPFGNAYIYKKECDISYIQNMFGLDHDVIQEIYVGSVGVAKMLVEVPSLSALFNLKPDYEKIIEFSRITDTRGVYVFTRETLKKDSMFHARQFNPFCGINEDPITGVAGAVLGALHGKDCIIEQGYSMNAFGRMHIRINKSDGQVTVGGHAIKHSEKKIII